MIMAGQRVTRSLILILSAFLASILLVVLSIFTTYTDPLLVLPTTSTKPTSGPNPFCEQLENQLVASNGEMESETARLQEVIRTMQVQETVGGLEDGLEEAREARIGRALIRLCSLEMDPEELSSDLLFRFQPSGQENKEKNILDQQRFQARPGQSPIPQDQDTLQQQLTNETRSNLTSDLEQGGKQRKFEKRIKVISRRRTRVKVRRPHVAGAVGDRWFATALNGSYLKARLMQDWGGSQTSERFTERLWNFKDPHPEKLFLYGKVFQHPWQPNYSNLQQLRRELYRAGFQSQRDFVVTKTNTAIDGLLTYYFKRSRKPNSTSAYQDAFKVTKDFWSRLPLLSPVRGATGGRPYRSCAVIGNSGILLNSSCGAEIDSHDMVFRCNAAPIAKYASDAGRRSNLTSFNPTIFKKRYSKLETEEAWNKLHQDFQEYHGYIWFPCFGSPSLNKICLKPFLSENRLHSDEPNYLYGHPEHFVSLWKFWTERNVTKTPSTGFYLTHASLQLCDETHLYGFWPFPAHLDTGVRLVHYHYFDHQQVTLHHAMNDEFSILAQYHELGILQVHVDQCQKG